MKNKIFQSRVCVCAHLTQTRYAQKTCAEMWKNMQKNILCFGDSNTHGYNSKTGGRFDVNER